MLCVGLVSYFLPRLHIVSQRKRKQNCPGVLVQFPEQGSLKPSRQRQTQAVLCYDVRGNAKAAYALCFTRGGLIYSYKRANW